MIHSSYWNTKTQRRREKRTIHSIPHRLIRTQRYREIMIAKQKNSVSPYLCGKKNTLGFKPP